MVTHNHKKKNKLSFEFLGKLPFGVILVTFQIPMLLKRCNINEYDDPKIDQPIPLTPVHKTYNPK